MINDNHFNVIIDWTSTAQYQSMPINEYVSINIDIDLLIGFPVFNFH